MSQPLRKVIYIGDTIDPSSVFIPHLSAQGFPVEPVANAREALDRLRSSDIDLLLVEFGTDADDRIQLMRQLQKENDSPPIIALSPSASVNEAVQAMQLGAVDYLALPVSAERLAISVELALSVAASEVPAHPSQPGPIHGGENELVTQDAELLALLDMARRVADSDATVLVTGESGTGKELLAAYVHAHSGRAQAPFVAMNCAALPDQLAENELFGHEKGAFTGALTRKLGRFEMADGGTLLLDEIGELPLTLQAKLLRVLQIRMVDRIGGQAPVSVDTRVVATTNRDLKQMVTDGTFRQDLYYRLKVLPFELPPLRKRREDIPLLVDTFIARFSGRHGRLVTGIAPEALARLEAHSWPGNIRELQNTIERGVLICRNTTLQSEDLLVEDPQTALPEDLPAGTTVKEMERRLILSTLGQVNANRTRAAEMLGISIRTLRNKLNEYRSENPELSNATG
ncbi:MAG: sigma-54 dependent transcriptional regulator [Desulfosarcinaceae bacterium]|nr:sigma-54 dependent transcriptional regulator [Desulfosarcinaceae bacterium]